MRLTLVAAMDRNRLIGAGNTLPWRLPADLAHFRRITLGHPVLMGRRTFESIGRPLPGRRNLVLTRDAGFRPPGVEVFASLETALAGCVESRELMVIGGASVYLRTLDWAQCLRLTLIDHTFAGDTWFPAWDPRRWRETAREDHPADARNPYPYSFVTLERG